MGQPNASDCIIRRSRKRTRGTETSKYPQEKKVNTIPPVVASERGGAQTGAVAMPRRGYRSDAKYKSEDRRKVWKDLPQRVKVPYPKFEEI